MRKDFIWSITFFSRGFQLPYFVSFSMCHCSRCVSNLTRGAVTHDKCILYLLDETHLHGYSHRVEYNRNVSGLSHRRRKWQLISVTTGNGSYVGLYLEFRGNQIKLQQNKCLNKLLHLICCSQYQPAYIYIFILAVRISCFLFFCQEH